MTNPWSAEDAALSIPQGWNVFEIWDGRIEYEIQKDENSNIFLTDEAAREYVKARAARGDALARRAVVIVFRSKCGDTPPTTEGRKT